MRSVVAETRNLKKRYGKHLAVNNVSLSVPEGCIYGLLGPNGAGKSTTMKMLTGLIKPTEGEVFVFGEPWQRAHLKSMGALIESPALYGNLTATENLQIHTRLMGLWQERDEINRVLALVGLTDTGRKLTSQFSTGMKQRLGIAIALLGNPRLLILDEPTNGLDPLGIQELRGLIRSLPSKGISVILSSHILTEVAQIVNHVGIISEGELKFEGSVDPGLDLEELFIKTVGRGK